MEKFLKNQQIPLTQVIDPSTGQAYYAPQNVVYNDKVDSGPTYLRDVIVDQANTASYFSGSITNAISASYALTASYVAGSIASASYALSASYAATASYAQNIIISGSINNVDYIDFNTSASTPAWRNGRIFWDNTDGALSVYNAEQDVTLNVGQENWTRVSNRTGTTITNGTVVRLIGAHGDVPEVERAQSLLVSGSVNVLNQILGVATHDIEDNSKGFITTQGLVRGLNTNAFNDGDTLFVGTGSAGVLQNTPPIAPYEIIPVGVCVKASPGTSGIIYVAVQEPIDFSDLSSALVQGTYSYGDLWTYIPSGSVGVWTHTNQLSGSYSITGSLRATSITGSFSGSVTAPGSTTQVVFNNGGVLGANSGFVYSGSRIGIGTTTPSYPLEVSGSARVNGTLQTNYLSFRTADSFTAIYPTDDGFNPVNNGNLLRFQSNTLTVARYGYNFRNATGTRTWTSGTGGDVVVASTYSPTSGTGIFSTMVLETTVNQTGGANGITRGLYLAPTLTAAADWRSIENTVGNNLLNSTSGNTYIGLSTNAGTAKLQVRGAGATSATNTFIVQNSTPSNLLTIQDNGQFTFSSPVISLATSQSAFVISQSISQSNVVGAQVYGVNITPTFFSTTASQTETAFRVSATFTGSAITTGSTNIIADFGATSVGSMLTITDITSGSIYKVNDVSGLPILEATSDWTVNMYNFPSIVFQKTGSRIGIGKTAPSTTLDISGSTFITGSLLVTGGITGSLQGTASYATSHAVTVSSYVCQGKLTADQTIPDSVDTILEFVDDFDPQNWYNTSSYEFTPTIAGYYNVSLGAWLTTPGADNRQTNLQIRKNGTTVMIVQQQTNLNMVQSLNGSKLVYLNGTTDYLDFTLYQSAGVSLLAQYGNSDGSGTWFSAHLITM